MESQILDPGISQASASSAHGDLGVVSMLARGADSASAQRQSQRLRACLCFSACLCFIGPAVVGFRSGTALSSPGGGCCATHQRRVSDQPAGAVVGRRLRPRNTGAHLYEPASDSCSGPSPCSAARTANWRSIDCEHSNGRPLGRLRGR